MTKLNEIYKCNTCGNILEVVHASIGELVCCEQHMELLKEKNQDTGQEKHVPVIEKTPTGVKIKVGVTAHPMEPTHYIQWIEFIADADVRRKFLEPGDVPEAEFCTKAVKITARAYCNVHGLWKN